jgi:hypothetical protein
MVGGSRRIGRHPTAQHEVAQFVDGDPTAAPDPNHPNSAARDMPLDGPQTDTETARCLAIRHAENVT